MRKLIYFLSCIFILACGRQKDVTRVAIEPSESFLSTYYGKNLAVVLDDMKIDEDSYSITYKHKYNVLKLLEDSLHQIKHPWKNVSEDFFNKHKEDLGMEILSKHNGKVSRVAQPVGLGWAVGNEKHGKWEVSNDTINNTSNTTRRRWRSHGSSPFLWYLLLRNSFSQRSYNNYRTHAASGKPFYGKNTNGSYSYGTRSTYQKTKRASFFSRKKTNGSRWTRLSRGSSRYSSGSSTRSRSGGFGK